MHVRINLTELNGSREVGRLRPDEAVEIGPACGGEGSCRQDHAPRSSHLHRAGSLNTRSAKREPCSEG